jgi:glucan phosphoethanolaminetransferase (alkaline phosphatase superfamily)
MVQLDHALIRSARSLMTGANVHRVKQMIFVYEQAVLLHNDGSHAAYQDQPEKELRQFVERESLRRLKQ